MPPRAVFITGAAAGIGRAIATRFAGEGWAVGLYDIDAGAVAATAAEIGGTTVSGAFDVTDSDGWERSLASFTESTGRLDVLVNNAGILYSGGFTDITLEQHYRLLDVNLKGLLTGCHTALLYLQRTPGSQVVNLASASALFGQPGLASYGASKAAVRSLTEALDLEWRSLGIAVHDVLPLFVATHMMEDVNRGAQSAKSLGVRLTADDVAESVWRTVTQPRRIPHTHVLVGRQTKLLAAATKLSPFWLNRLVVGRLAKADALTHDHS